MNGRGDYPDEMSDLPLDDAATEALLRGDAPAADPKLAAVAAFIGEMRASASRPAPAPSPALAALLREGAGVPAREPVAVKAGRRRSSAAGWRRRLAVAGIGFGVAVTGVVGAGAAGLLPEPVENVVGGVVEAVTPLELPVRRSTSPASDGGRPDDAVPGSSTTTGGRESEPAPGPTSQGSPQTGPTTGRTAPGAAGSTSTTQAPNAGPGSSVPPPATSSSAPRVGPGATPPTTSPAPAPLPSPTLPNVGTTLPTTPSTLPDLPVSLPPIPW